MKNLSAEAAVTYGWAVCSHPVPEPATMSLLALGGVAALRRRRRR